MTPKTPADQRVTKADVDGLRADVAGLRADLYGDDPSGDSGIIGFLRHGFRGNRLRIRIGIALIIFDLILSAGYVHKTFGAQSSCNAANETRAAQRQLWGYILHLSTPTTPEAAVKAQEFRLYVDHQFAPRNCSFWSNL